MNRFAKRSLSFCLSVAVLLLSLPGFAQLRSAAADNWTSVQDYESLDPAAAPAAKIPGILESNGMAAADTDPDYVQGGRQNLKVSYGNGNRYPWYSLLAPQGSFAGEGVRFHLSYEGHPAGADLLQISECNALLADGSTVKLFSYSKRSGWVEVKYSGVSGLTPDKVAAMTGIKVTVNNTPNTAFTLYIDDLQVLNTPDGIAPEAADAVCTQEKNGDVTVSWRMSDNATAADTLQPVLYYSADPIQTQTMDGILAGGEIPAALTRVELSAGALTHRVTGVSRWPRIYAAIVVQDAAGNQGYTLSSHTYRVLEDYEDLDPAAAPEAKIPGILESNGMAVADSDPDYVQGGHQNLKVSYGNGNRYPWYTLLAPQGSFAGEGVRFHLSYEGHPAGADLLQITQCDALLADGSTVKLFSYSKRSGWVEIKYSGVSGLTPDKVAAMTGIKVTVNNSPNTAFTLFIDDFQVIDPTGAPVHTDTQAPEAAGLTALEEMDGDITVSWRMSDDTTAAEALQPTLYYSPAPITGEMMDSLLAGGALPGEMTRVEVPAGQSRHRVSGLNRRMNWYFALVVRDAAGNQSYALSEGTYRVLQDYENLDPAAAPAAKIPGILESNGMAAADTDPDYVQGGRQNLKVSYGNGNRYPWYSLLAPQGSFAGEGVRFHLSYEGHPAGAELLQISECNALLADGSTVKLFSYSKRSGWIEVKYSGVSGLTPDKVAAMTGIKVTVNNLPNTALTLYIDNFQVIEPEHLGEQASVTDLTILRDKDKTIRASWTAQGDPAKLTLYYAEAPLTAAVLDTLRAGGSTAFPVQSLEVPADASSAVLEDVDPAVRTYYAAAAEDESGTAAYAFCETVYGVIQDFEELPAGQPLTNDNQSAVNIAKGGAAQVNTDPAYLTGGRQSVKLIPSGYTAFTLRAAAGSLMGDGLRFHIQYQDNASKMISSFQLLLADGTKIKLWEYKSPLGWITVPYADYPALTPEVTAQVVGVELVSHNHTVPMYIDDFQVVNPTPMEGEPLRVADLTAVRDKAGDTVLGWVLSDTALSRLDLYYTQGALDAATLEALKAGEIPEKVTRVPVGKEDTAATVAGLAPYTRYAFVLIAADTLGTTASVTCTDVYSVLQDYEDLDPGEPVPGALINYHSASQMAVGTDPAYASSGRQSLMFTPSKEVDWPWYTLRAGVGDLLGEGLRFHLRFTDDNVLQTTEVKAVFADGSAQSLFTYRGLNGWVTIRYADHAQVLTEERLPQLVGLQITLNNRSRLSPALYIDDLQVLNRREYVDPTEYLTLFDFENTSSLPAGVSVNAIDAAIQTAEGNAHQGQSLVLSELENINRNYPSLTLNVTQDTLNGEGIRFWFKPDFTDLSTGDPVQFQVSEISLESRVGGQVKTFSTWYKSYNPGFADFITVRYAALQDEKGNAPTREDIQGFERIFMVFNCQPNRRILLYFDTVQVINPVHEPVTGVLLNENKLELSVGGAYQAGAQVQPHYALNKRLTWESADERVALVDTRGMITAVGKGKTTVRVKTVDGGFTAACTVLVRERDISASRMLFDFESGVVPAATVVSGGRAAIEYNHADEGASLALTAAGERAAVTLVPETPYAFYGMELSVWLMGQPGVSVRLVLTTASGQEFVYDAGAPSEDGDALAVPYAEFRHPATGRAPTQEDTIQFRSLRIEAAGGKGTTLNVDSIRVLQPRSYGMVTTPINSDGGLGVQVADPDNALGSLVWQVYEVLDGVDYDWAWERLEANQLVAGRTDAQLFQLNFLDSGFSARHLQRPVSVSYPIPTLFQGIPNLWVLYIGADGTIEGVRAVNDGKTLTFPAHRSGLYVLAAVDSDAYLRVEGGAAEPQPLPLPPVNPPEPGDTIDPGQEEPPDGEEDPSEPSGGEPAPTEPGRSDPAAPTQPKTGLPAWALALIIGGGVLAVAGGVLAVVLVRRRQKREEDPA